MTLRVSRLDGRVTLSVPAHVPERTATEFAHSRETWLRKALADVPRTTSVAPGTVLPFQGSHLMIVASGGRRTERQDADLHVPNARAGAATAAYLKTTARDCLAAASDRHADALGVRYHQLVLRDTRSRWGSCSADGRLMYSWRLVMAPPEVLDYVAAHEVAHLVHMDHSPAFWGVVADLCPPYKSHRRWLRENGPELHRFVFRD